MLPVHTTAASRATSPYHRILSAKASSSCHRRLTCRRASSVRVHSSLLHTRGSIVRCRTRWGTDMVAPLPGSRSSRRASGTWKLGTGCTPPSRRSTTRSTIGIAACQNVSPPAKRGEHRRAQAPSKRLLSPVFSLKPVTHSHSRHVHVHNRYMRQRVAGEALEANYHAALAPLLRRGSSAF